MSEVILHAAQNVQNQPLETEEGEEGVLLPHPHLFMSRSRGSRRPTGEMPSTDQKAAAAARLKEMEEEGATTTQAVEYLLQLGWSTAAIRDSVRYPSQTRGHKKGDPLLPQHVNAIKTRYEQKTQVQKA